MSSPSVAVVILNWNGKKFLQQFLASVVNSVDENQQVIIIDNASTDDSVAFVRENFPSVKIILNETNAGFAGGYNEGLKNVDAEYLVLLNQDVEVPDHWISPVISMMEKDEMIAAAQPKIKMFSDKSSYEYAGAAGGLVDRNYYPFCRGRIFDTLEKDEGQYEKEEEIFWASGACLFVRKKIVDACGGFDADFFAHQEEIDLCWRMKNRGYKIMYCPAAEVYHVGGGSLNRSNPFKTFLNFRNSLYSILKNEHGSRLWAVLFRRFIYDGVAGIRFLMQGKGGDFLAVIRAHGYFYFHFRKTWLKRKKLKKDSSVPDRSGYIPVNIIWRYFIQGKKTWN